MFVRFPIQEFNLTILYAFRGKNSLSKLALFYPCVFPTKNVERQIWLSVTDRLGFKINRLLSICSVIAWKSNRIPTVKLRIPGKSMGKSGYRTSVTFKLNKCFSQFFMVADLLSPNRCHWQIAKVKNYNLNVTEIRDSDLKNAFPGIFNFTVGILVKVHRAWILKIFVEARRNPMYNMKSYHKPCSYQNQQWWYGLVRNNCLRFRHATYWALKCR